MIRRIATKEFTEILREGRFQVAAIITIALLLISVVISRSYYVAVNEQHAQARQVERALWLNQEAKNPHSAAHYGTYAFKPKYLLALLDPGVDKYTGISIYLEAHRRNEAQYMAAQDQTGLARFGDLTPDFILLFIIPLLIVLMGFNAFTREREQGTLALLKSQGVLPSNLAFGKWLGSYLAIVLLVVPVFIISAILLALVKDFGPFNIGALLLLLLVYLVYYAIFTGLTLTVSAGSKNSGVALVTMLAVWMVSVLGMPKVASNLADALYPYPTRQAFEAGVNDDKKRGLNGHEPWSEEAKALEKAVLVEYKVDSVQQLPFNFDGYLMQKGEEHDAEIYYKHYALLRQQFENQTNVYRLSAILSPFLPTRFLSMGIARSDYQTHWHFADAAEKYRVSMMDKLNMTFAKSTTYSAEARNWKADPSLWKQIPPFEYEPPTYATLLQQQTSNLLILLGWLGLSFWGLIYVTKKV